MELDREARWGLVWVVFWSVVCVVGSINLLVNGSTASALVLLGILVFIAVRWWVKLQQRVDLRAAGLDRIDMMSGIEFEQYVAAVLGGSGFAVTLTKTTGDFGVDLIAVKDGLRTAVQCKRQARSVGTAAIQQVVAGAVMYRCTSVMVVTNGLFTLAAQKLAKAHRVGLVDRMRLERLAISGRRTQDAAGTTSTRTVADTNRTHDDGTFGALAPTQKCPPEQVPTERRETSAQRFGETPPSRPWWLSKAAGLLYVITLVIAIAVSFTRDQGTTTGPDQGSTTAPARQYAPQTTLSFDGLEGPWEVTVDSNGTVYVADTSNNRVLNLAADSTTQKVVPFTGLNQPLRVAVDNTGTVYVSDRFNNRVVALSPGSTNQQVLPFTGLDHPNGVAVDSSGAVYVADTRNNRVVSLAAGSNNQAVLPFADLSLPQDVTVNSSDTVYVSDMDNNRVLSLVRGSTTGTVLPFTDLRDPSGLAVDSHGTVYVTDNKNRVLSLATGSSHQAVLPLIGLNYPHGVAVNERGTVYVADQANDRVVKLAPG